jgi:hypothetical protein
MAVPLERAFQYAASAVTSNCRREEIIIDLKDAGLSQDDALWLVGELIRMRDDLRRTSPGQPVTTDALLARWHEQHGETTAQLIAEWRERERIADAARQSKPAVQQGASFVMEAEAGRPSTGPLPRIETRSYRGAFLGAVLGAVLVHPLVLLLAANAGALVVDLYIITAGIAFLFVSFVGGIIGAVIGVAIGRRG